MGVGRIVHNEAVAGRRPCRTRDRSTRAPGTFASVCSGAAGPKLWLMRTDHEVTLTVDEVAARLRSTPSRIRDLIEEGELRFAPTTDINDIRVPESALAELPAALC